MYASRVTYQTLLDVINKFMQTEPPEVFQHKNTVQVDKKLFLAQPQWFLNSCVLSGESTGQTQCAV